MGEQGKVLRYRGFAERLQPLPMLERMPLDPLVEDSPISFSCPRLEIRVRSEVNPDAPRIRTQSPQNNEALDQEVGTHLLRDGGVPRDDDRDFQILREGKAAFACCESQSLVAWCHRQENPAGNLFAAFQVSLRSGIDIHVQRLDGPIGDSTNTPSTNVASSLRV